MIDAITAPARVSPSEQKQRGQSHIDRQTRAAKQQETPLLILNEQAFAEDVAEHGDGGVPDQEPQNAGRRRVGGAQQRRHEFVASMLMLSASGRPMINM